jgi:hypothetical protein
MRKYRQLFLVGLLFLSSCKSGAQTPIPSLLPAANTSSAPLASIPPTPIIFPPSINPLTGQPVTDPALLKIPAVLISISHFPATGRPQAGLSFAPFVYEFSITEGATRFLAVFYGELPSAEISPTGDCEVRSGSFTQTATILGNRVWLDRNADGLQQVNEPGVGGVCVNLYDPGGNLIQQTTTDSNGYYGFNIQPGGYMIEFNSPKWAQFTKAKVGEHALDSDADPVTGRADANISSDDLTFDAGLVPRPGSDLGQDASLMPLSQVGPIRSGRLINGYIADYFENSCLIYAGASSEVLARLPQCYLVYHQLAGGGYMLDLKELRLIADKNQRKKGSVFDYASNIFTDAPPSGGLPASAVSIYIAYQNQSGWTYDPLYQAYLRYVDTSEYEQAGVLYPDHDRLTGRQLHFENLVVLLAKHEVISPTNLDIHLNPGTSGKALLFRDGCMFQIKWNTFGADEKHKHPIGFTDADGHPIPLKPGHTWVLVVTPESTVEEKSPGKWRVLFSPPPGAK